MNYKLNKFILIILILLLIITGLKPKIILAQTTEEVPKINPLEIRERDLLLPSIDRPLSEFELKKLREALEELDKQAQAQLEAGNDDEAFTIWYRELRLTRVFGTAEEIKALTKVGKIAWEKTRNQDINYINERLLILEAENKNKKGEINSELLPFFVEAYESLHNIDKSIEVYRQVLALARQNQDKTNINLALDKLGQFYLAKFNYYEAEPIYKELLTLAREEENYLKEGIYLRKLAEINTEIVKPENSVNYKQQLAENQLANKDIQYLADLKIAIGDDYQLLNKPEEAGKYYQEAFALAWSLQQFASAGDALKKLAKLYEKYNQNNYALQIYQELIKVEQQSYNLYGLMNTYDAIAQIYIKDKNYSLALQWLKKCLEIAEHLKYKVNYFNTQIQEVNQQLNPPSPENQNNLIP